ncbi:dihydroorotate oxidase B, catalytic subunit [Desulforamulus reducens MI-1]|uniref:Dihydroorotate dehydrogenase B (NAD(+)), catalytic subunit n=1 Tax=Desulforamulus reducens (strain ATCC BAA-1160 / DSM 100696 / MI-1) TaxID=349161 RepID=PYRDB_DESRM|nr:dihydroorotate dehydrogenase [Desulforamulus reducens]A4J560.1 RecName: Full=Dihydroorotate dehydrogenase B (NAD(+)), catalytic subunit; Short=DHOD B; Short=DHODase B; Short=DHOdehase B; AltName: Full=Dihydroorotate oxidase B; AltName: Full=Orotate reductase (NADH) [Desulforamulus reducens MI-1]ABO50213.1 dihydroorotate oxidase B, catalytic subunit [Desulforamulus reducens MI-1]
MKLNLAVKIGQLDMINPVTTASGTFGYGQEYSPYVDLNQLGAIVVKGTTLEPREGNPTPRLVETPSGILNSIGLQNSGVDYLLEHYVPFFKKLQTNVIVNISGNTAEEYGQLAARLDEADGIAALEVNISCPNVKKGGMAFGGDFRTAAEVTKVVKNSTALPVIVKLSPNVTDIAEIARAVEGAGADGLSVINTLLGMAIDVRKRKPVLGNTMGGLSGPAVKPVALRAVWQVYKAVHIPIIGMGGIMNATDALEFILAGAQAVSVGTANFVNPYATKEIIQGMEKYLMENGIGDINELVGAAHL